MRRFSSSPQIQLDVGTRVAVIFLVAMLFASPSLVFGKIKKNKTKSVATKTTPLKDSGFEIPLPIKINGVEQSIEVVKVTANNNPQVLYIYSDSVFGIFANLLLEDRIDVLKKTFSGKAVLTSEEFKINDMTLSYDQSGAVSIILPITWLKNKDIIFKRRDLGSIDPNVFPSKVSGSLDLTGQSFYNTFDKSFDNNYLTADFSMNSRGLILNTGLRNNNQGTRRTETNLNYSFSPYSDLWLGDITRSDAGMPGGISGIGFFKSADPSSLTNPSVSQFIDIASASIVSIYKNEQLMRRFNANPGKAYFGDLPMDSGNNVIRIVIEDIATGQSTEKIITEFIPIYGVKKGDYSFSGIFGKSRTSENGYFNYSKENSLFTNFNYGVSNIFTTGVSFTKSDYSGSLGINESFIFSSFSFRLSALRSMNIFSFQNEYSLGFGKSGSFLFLNNISTELKQIVRDFGDPLYVYQVSNVRASIKDFLKITPSVGYEQRISTDGTSEETAFMSASRSFRFSKSWNFTTSATESHSTKANASDFGINFSLTYSENTDSGRLGFAINDDKSSRKTSGSYSWDKNSIAAGVNTNKKSSSAETSLSATSGNDLGTLQGSYSYSNKISSYSLLGKTGLYFTDSAVAISNPGKQSFVIIKNSESDGDFEVTSIGGNKIAESKLFSSTVIGALDYSVVSFNIFPKDQSVFFLDSMKNYAYGAEHKTGGSVSFSNNRKVFITTKIRTPDRKLAENVEIKLVCNEHDKEIKQELLTNSEGSLSFSAEKGAVCRLLSGAYRSNEIAIDFAVKHKEIEDVTLAPYSGNK